MISKILHLSYQLQENSPTYGNGEGFGVSPDGRISQGGSCDTDFWSLPNHIGTHIDFPSHFVSGGKNSSDYQADFWIFNGVQLLDFSTLTPGTIISPAMFEGMEIESDTELLLVKTGFCKFRGEKVYWQNNPGFATEMADFLRESCPALRVLGFDSISLSSFSDRPLGRIAHKAFLGGGKPILPLEDMDLNQVGEDTKFRQVVVAPLQVAGANGAPCNVIAEVNK